MGSLRMCIVVSSLYIAERLICELDKITLEHLVRIMCMILSGLYPLNWIKSTTVYPILGSCVAMFS